MYTRRITWTRPNNTVDWPWVGLEIATAYNESLLTMPGFSQWLLEEATDTTYVVAYVWQTHSDWYNHSLLPITVDVIAVQVPIMAERNITKSITEEGI